MEEKIDLTSILDEEDIGKKINKLAVISYDNRIILLSHSAALIKLEEQCKQGYNKREKVINWGSAVGAFFATAMAIWAVLMDKLNGGK